MSPLTRAKRSFYAPGLTLDGSGDDGFVISTLLNTDAVDGPLGPFQRIIRCGPTRLASAMSGGTPSGTAAAYEIALELPAPLPSEVRRFEHSGVSAEVAGQGPGLALDGAGQVQNRAVVEEDVGLGEGQPS